MTRENNGHGERGTGNSANGMTAGPPDANQGAATATEPCGAACETAAAPPPATADKARVPYTRYQVLTHIDTEGRTFQELRSRDGSPDLFEAVAVVERRWPDGLGARQPFPFRIPATSVDEAFARYDEAKRAAEKAGEEAMDREHTRAILSGQIPMPPPLRVAQQAPPQGRGGRRRN